MTQKQRIRSTSALTRLESQLKSGTKPEKAGKKTTSKSVPLTEQDTKRINKEIETLSKKVN